jgi:tetratricopeptide (TPR) repeat protein
MASEALNFLGWNEEQIEDVRLAGYCYLKQGLYDVATIYYKALVTLNPLSLYDLQTLGALLLQQGIYDEALTYLNKALTIEPKHLVTKLNKLKTLFMMGDKEKALPLAAALKNCEDATIAKDAHALLLAHQ